MVATAAPVAAEARISRVRAPTVLHAGAPGQLDLKVTRVKSCRLDLSAPRRRAAVRRVRFRVRGRVVRIAWRTAPNAMPGRWRAAVRCGRTHGVRWRMRVVGRPGSNGSLMSPGTLKVVSSSRVAGGSLRSTADDYPYGGSPIGAIDQWGFLTRECTSFVAWRLNRDGGAGSFENGAGETGWGHAEHWDDSARARGYSVNGRPAAGSVAHWNAHEGFAGWAGHVGYVAGVNSDGSALIEDYHGAGDHHYGVRIVRAPRYIHVNR